MLVAARFRPPEKTVSHGVWVDSALQNWENSGAHPAHLTDGLGPSNGGHVVTRRDWFGATLAGFLAVLAPALPRPLTRFLIPRFWRPVERLTPTGWRLARFETLRRGDVMRFLSWAECGFPFGTPMRVKYPPEYNHAEGVWEVVGLENFGPQSAIECVATLADPSAS